MAARDVLPMDEGFKGVQEDQIYDQRIAEMAKRHSSEAFYALDDPSRGSRVFGTDAVI